MESTFSTQQITNYILEVKYDQQETDNFTKMKDYGVRSSNVKNKEHTCRGKEMY